MNTIPGPRRWTGNYVVLDSHTRTWTGRSPLPHPDRRHTLSALMPSRMVTGLTAVALIASAGVAHAQNANPKAAFTSGLASFSVALDGSFGDEGAVITNGLATMDRARQQWDAVIRAYETG